MAFCSKRYCKMFQAIPPADDTNIKHPADTSSTTGLSENYDLIVIGGETAGLVVAARLTETPEVKVLVLEAEVNRHNDPKILTPGVASILLDNPEYDWEFFTVPQLNGRQVPAGRGKVLGGSSALYQHQLVYSSASTFRAWVAMGNPGWDWESMLRYLKKFHTHQAPLTSDAVKEIEAISYKDAGVESSSGPIQSLYSPTGDVEKAWYETWQKIMEEMDYDGDKLGGFAVPNGINAKTRARSYAATASYSSDIASRPNLRVVTEARVQKIMLQRAGNEVKATGVQFLSKSSQPFTINANKEVILSAGSLQSPQLLELSGIGGRDLLSQHSIEVIVDNPNVGENLQNHHFVPISFEAAEGVPTADAFLRDPSMLQTFMQVYEKDGSGPLGSFFIPAAQAKLPSVLAPTTGATFLPNLFQSVSRERTELDAITLDLLAQEDGATAMYQLAKAQLNVAGNTQITKMLSPTTPGEFLILFTSLNHSFSHGNVHISSGSIADPPRIDPRYFSHAMDLEVMARHIQFLSKLVNTPPLKRYFKEGGKRIPENAFGEKEIGLEDAKTLVRENMITNYDPAGSCMMVLREKGGVVDERLRVHGVRGLRVVDASVFPVMPRGNIITSCCQCLCDGGEGRGYD